MDVADKDLTPSNATDLEREMARLSARLDAIDPRVIETIWDAWSCPAALLPWLAWALSVDLWDDGWDLNRKRQAIADSPAYHRRKGTRAAVDAAIAMSGADVSLIEWWEIAPQRRRGTAAVHAAAQDYGAIASLVRELRRLVDSAKPKARAVAIGAGPRVPGVLSIAGGVVIEETIRIEPYAYAGETVTGGVVIAGGLFIEETVRINPQ